MPAIAWPPNRVEIAWGVLAVVCLAAMIVWPSWETIPFHVIWITLTLLYGFRVWSPAVTGAVLGAVIIGTGASILSDAFEGLQLWGELFEVPLMSAMFLAMVWHARRRVQMHQTVGGARRRTRGAPRAAGAARPERLARVAHAGDDRARPPRPARAASRPERARDRRRLGGADPDGAADRPHPAPHPGRARGVARARPGAARHAGRGRGHALGGRRAAGLARRPGRRRRPATPTRPGCGPRSTRCSRTRCSTPTSTT